MPESDATYHGLSSPPDHSHGRTASTGSLAYSGVRFVEHSTLGSNSLSDGKTTPPPPCAGQRGSRIRNNLQSILPILGPLSNFLYHLWNPITVWLWLAAPRWPVMIRHPATIFLPSAAAVPWMTPTDAVVYDHLLATTHASAERGIWL